jgi:hypothetical protein
MICKIIGQCLLFLRILSDFLNVKTIKDARKNYFVHSFIQVFFSWRKSPCWARASSLSRFYDYTPFDTAHSVGLP